MHQYMDALFCKGALKLRGGVQAGLLTLQVVLIVAHT
jgi:hypothetical protein